MNAKIPERIQVIAYFILLGLDIKHADAFYYYYSQQHWEISEHRPVKNWKCLAFNWVRSFGKAKVIRKKSIHLHR